MKYKFTKTMVIDRAEFLAGDIVDNMTERNITPGQFQSLILTGAIVAEQESASSVAAENPKNPAKK